MEDWVKVRSARLKQELETTRKHLAFEKILDEEIAKLQDKGLDYFEARMIAKSTPQYRKRRKEHFNI